MAPFVITFMLALGNRGDAVTANMDAGRPVTSLMTWPVVLPLAETGLPDVDGSLLLKLLAILALGLLLWNQVQEARGKRKPPAAPQPLIITMKEQFVERETFDELKAETHNQLKEIRAYTHDGMHGVHGELKAIYAAAEQREKRLDEKLEKHWRELNKERSVSTAKLHERLEATDRAMRSEVDTKIKEVREDIRETPERIVSLLRQTGAIGANHGGTHT